MKVLAIIQARLESQRLPDKVLLQIPQESGMSMLEMVIRKVMLAKLVDKIAVVTPDRKLAEIVYILFPNILCCVKLWEGRDVLREFFDAAGYENLTSNDLIVRITADCALIQPHIIDENIERFINSDVNLIYNTDESTGQLNGEGSDVEVFSYETLALANIKAKEKDEREHVTLWMRRNCKKLFVPNRELGLLSVNTEEEYKKVCKIVRNNVLFADNKERKYPPRSELN